MVLFSIWENAWVVFLLRWSFSHLGEFKKKETETHQAHGKPSGMQRRPMLQEVKICGKDMSTEAQ